jgi:hypothetical protein
MNEMSNKTGAKKIAEAMPLLIQNGGVWEGVYRHYSAVTGKLVDEHLSRLICRITEGEANDYHQTNYYYWEDGRTEIRDFPAQYKDGRIWFDNELIAGWAAAMQPDDFHRSQCLNWIRKGEPGLYLYEMIQNSDDGKGRYRTWHWFKDGKCFQRTLIDEYFVTADWQNWTDLSAPKIPGFQFLPKQV